MLISSTPPPLRPAGAFPQSQKLLGQLSTQRDHFTSQAGHQELEATYTRTLAAAHQADQAYSIFTGLGLAEGTLQAALALLPGPAGAASAAAASSGAGDSFAQHDGMVTTILSHKDGYAQPENYAKLVKAEAKLSAHLEETLNGIPGGIREEVEQGLDATIQAGASHLALSLLVA